MDRRAVLGVLGLGSLGAVLRATPARTQEAGATATARAFVADLVAVGGKGEAEAMRAFLAERLDMGFVVGAALAPVAGRVTEEEARRLAKGLLGSLGAQAIGVAGLAQGGGFTLTGERAAQGGTAVSGIFRDGSGDVPFEVLVGSAVAAGDVSGTRGLVRDFGTPGSPSFVAGLAATMATMAEVSADPEVWIGAFEASS